MQSPLPTPKVQALENDILSLIGSNMDQTPRWNRRVQGALLLYKKLCDREAEGGQRLRPQKGIITGHVEQHRALAWGRYAKCWRMALN